eukprot:1136653-Pelagomonas_calceolata.AAC.4
MKGVAPEIAQAFTNAVGGEELVELGVHPGGTQDTGPAKCGELQAKWWYEACRHRCAHELGGALRARVVGGNRLAVRIHSGTVRLSRLSGPETVVALQSLTALSHTDPQVNESTKCPLCCQGACSDAASISWHARALMLLAFMHWHSALQKHMARLRAARVHALVQIASLEA